ncbi:class I SAM-dependent methyltransferase [Streptomyces sp. NPDC001250]|uniref:class I SAM-dependent methyltransferase n=1 Tax=unclassified Streptomyces TaxID=2593676 RepID=UPI003333DB3B
MTTAIGHYARLLAEHYTWMPGGDIAAVAEDQTRLLSELGVRPGAAGTLAVDLGCGPGPQSLALASLGFSPVLAVDTSEPLLAELAAHTGHSSVIRPLHADTVRRWGNTPSRRAWPRWCAWATPRPICRARRT